MPLDGKHFEKIDPVLQPGLAGLAQLEHALRNPQLWPVGFVWSFSEAHSCAWGLGRMLWGDEFPWLFEMDRLGFVSPEHRDVFSCRAYRPIPDHLVTPVMVADRIASLLKEKGYQREVSHAA